MEPLAAQIRPETIEEFVGQKHLLGEGKPLRAAIEGKHLFSLRHVDPRMSHRERERQSARRLDERLDGRKRRELVGAERVGRERRAQGLDTLRAYLKDQGVRD